MNKVLNKGLPMEEAFETPGLTVIEGDLNIGGQVVLRLRLTRLRAREALLTKRPSMMP